MKRQRESLKDDYVVKAGKGNNGRRKPAAQRAGKSGGLTAAQAKQVAAMVERKITSAAEKKFYDDMGNGDFLDATPIIVDLTAVTQGASQIQRTGEEITIAGLGLRAALFGNPDGIMSSPAYFDQQYRIMIVQWYTDTATSPPTLADILQNSTLPMSWYERQNAGRNFKVVYDVKGLLSGSQGSPDAQKMIDTWIPGKAFKKVLFDTDNTTGTNHVFLMAFGNAVTNGPLINWNTHLTFTDL